MECSEHRHADIAAIQAVTLNGSKGPDRALISLVGHRHDLADCGPYLP